MRSRRVVVHLARRIVTPEASVRSCSSRCSIDRRFFLLGLRT